MVLKNILWRGMEIQACFWENNKTKSDAPVIIGLHGLGFDGISTYKKLGDYFTETEYAVVTFDFPGFGNSELDVNFQLSFNNLSDLIYTVYKMTTGSVNNKKIILVSHSMGGAMALSFIDKFSDIIVAYCSLEGNCCPGGGYFSKKIVKMTGKRLDRFFELFVRQVLKNPENQGMTQEYAEALNKTSADVMWKYSNLLVNQIPEKLFDNVSSNLKNKLFMFADNSSEGLELSDLYKKREYQIIKVEEAQHDILNSQPEKSIKYLHEWFNTIFYE